MGVTIIRLKLRPAWNIICLAMKSDFIIPIGFSFDLNGPSIIFLIFNFFLCSLLSALDLKLTNWPISLLLISYAGLKAGWISASEVFTQISLLSKLFFWFIEIVSIKDFVTLITSFSDVLIS